MITTPFPAVQNNNDRLFLTFANTYPKHAILQHTDYFFITAPTARMKF